MRKRVVKSSDLVLSALAIILGLSLSRSWVSEQNLNFVLPLVLLASISQGWSRKWVTATWLLPLVFAIFHSKPLEMFFLVMPQQLIDRIHAQLHLFLVAASFGMLQSDISGTVLVLSIVAWVVIGVALLRKSICEVGALSL